MFMPTIPAFDGGEKSYCYCLYNTVREAKRNITKGMHETFVSFDRALDMWLQPKPDDYDSLWFGDFAKILSSSLFFFFYVY